MMNWKKVSEQRYWDMLEVLPPAVMTGRGFMVGEAWTHARCSVSGNVVPMFGAFIEHGGQFFEAMGPTSVAEFKSLKADDVLANVI